MSQLIFKFPFKTRYFEQDFYVSKNNFSAYKLIESWPDWPGKWVNIFGLSGSGKTHLIRILEKKIKKVKVYDAKNIDNESVAEVEEVDCFIIDNYKNNIEKNIFYSLLNQSKQLEKYILINSIEPLNLMKNNLPDLKSRIDSFIFIGIDLPTDDILKVIISKFFSDKQVIIDAKLIDYMIKNVERSYSRILELLKDIDELSLSSGKSININLIKKVLNKNE